MSTRRHFLLNCTALALAAAASPTLGLGAALPTRATSIDQISLADFKTYLQKSFRVSTASGASVQLVLVNAEAVVFKHAQAHHKDAANEKFRLLFQGPPSGALPQDTYSFENAQIGSIAMFITPVKCKDPAHSFYEAFFNRAPVSPLK